MNYFIPKLKWRWPAWQYKLCNSKLSRITEADQDILYQSDKLQVLKAGRFFLSGGETVKTPPAVGKTWAKRGQTWQSCSKNGKNIEDTHGSRENDIYIHKHMVLKITLRVSLWLCANDKICSFWTCRSYLKRSRILCLTEENRMDCKLS